MSRTLADLTAFRAGLKILKPRSRAKQYVTTHGSGASVRRYTCVACGALIDSESAKYRPTRHAETACFEHVQDCKAIDHMIRVGRGWLTQTPACGHSDCAAHPELAAACVRGDHG